jgi:pimeloyl-ACP methyl ester carboxylesterase
MSMEIRIVELEIDVTKATGWSSPLRTSVFVAIPSTQELRSPVCVLFAFPGGTHAKEYYDMSIRGLDDYSMAKHFARRGYVFVACDPLGVGRSSDPGSGDEVTRQLFVDANKGTVDGVMERLVRGELAHDLSAVRAETKLGLGTSMGAMLLVEQQASHRSFDGITMMGYSGIQTRLQTAPEDWSPPISVAAPINRDLLYTLYWDDIPSDVIAADQALAVAPPTGAVRAGGGYRGALEPGCVADAASSVDVPVLIAVGERDTCPDPHAEVAAYPKATDIALYIVPRAGHAPCVANTRHLLWDRIDAWARRVADRSPSGSDRAFF